MTRRIVLAIAAVALLASCASKDKTADSGNASASADAGAPKISEKDMTFNTQGSDSGQIPGLNTIFFEFDKSSLTAQARKDLAANAEWIKSHPNVNVQIEGHTDSRGSVEYNLALGERRAKSVKAYLTSMGVDGKRLSIISYGEEKPIEVGESESSWSKNRRANFVPMGQ